METYEYDILNNLASFRNEEVNYELDGNILSSFSYTYQFDRNVTSETDHNGVATTCTYDLLGRLISEVGGLRTKYYTYDNAGNRTKAYVDVVNTTTYSYNGKGQLVSETSTTGAITEDTTYIYDANGNLTSKTDGIVTTTYTFDVWGNMTSGAGASYTYNVQVLRTSKTVGNKTTNFTLVGGKVFSDGTYNYVWGAELISNGSVYYLYNAHGDVVQLINSSGTVTKTYDYDAYGNELERDLNDPNPFRYCGEYNDKELCPFENHIYPL